MTLQFTIDNRFSLIHRFQSILAGREVGRQNSDAACRQICDALTLIKYNVYDAPDYSAEKSLERRLLHDILTKISWVGILISWILILISENERKGKVRIGRGRKYLTVAVPMRWQYTKSYDNFFHIIWQPTSLSTNGEMGTGKISLSSNRSVPTSFVAAADW